MTAPHKLLIAAIALIAMATAMAATIGEASARGRHGGHGLRHHQPGQHRALVQRPLFTRHTPCVVWTRRGWSNVCGMPR